MNEYDSNRIYDLTKKINYLKTENLDEANCYVLNTCHIREKATDKVYHDIGRVKKQFRKKAKPIVLVTGCVAQAEGNILLEKEKYIDAVIGPQSYHKINKIIENFNFNKKEELTEFDTEDKFNYLDKIKNHDSRVSSFLTIQEGCDKFCNFCVVPYTRGPEYSRPFKQILEEANVLVENGAKEITLLGQNVNAYNFSKNNENFTLSSLIKELNNIKKLKRIRFTTSHPKDMSDDLIMCYESCDKLMPFLHLPIQSGSNKILKSMNRKHDKEYYLSIIQKIKNIKKDFKISSDFIIGYPGETEKDFNATIDLVNEIGFINSYSFIFSPRPGTPASDKKLNEQSINQKRLKKLQNILENFQIKNNKGFLEKYCEVLVENKLKNQPKYFGRTKCMTPVIFDSDNCSMGELVKVKITSCNQKNLFGFHKSNKEKAA